MDQIRLEQWQINVFVAQMTLTALHRSTRMMRERPEEALHFAELALKLAEYLDRHQ